MGTPMLIVPLAELGTIRIVCQGKTALKGEPCSAVFEMPLERLATAFQNPDIKCPFCGTGFQIYTPDGRQTSPFFALSEAIANLRAIESRVQIQFPLYHEMGLIRS